MQIQLEITGILIFTFTLLAAVVAVTRYITSIQFTNQNERFKEQIAKFKEQYSDLQTKYKDLDDEINRAHKHGKQALFKKREIESHVTEIGRKLRAIGGSVYIPIEPNAPLSSEQLVFLTMLPKNTQNLEASTRPIPISTTAAGKCFASKERLLINKASSSATFFSAIDNITGFHTDSIIAVPLIKEHSAIGVLQFVNDSNSYEFQEDDFNIIAPHVERITEEVYEYIQTPGSYELLGIVTQEENTEATIIFCDLTNSSLLIQLSNPGLAIRIINEYFETVCNVAIKFDATLENYAGDGVIFRFNVPRKIDDHPYVAAQAAIEMRDEFNKLKIGWTNFIPSVANLYIRIGISTGLVQETALGHPQYQRLTVFGQPAHVAAYLCEAASRKKNIILIDDHMYSKLGLRAFTERISGRNIKPFRFVDAVYELQTLGNAGGAVG